MAPKRKAAAPLPPHPPPAVTRSDESEDDDASADSPVRAVKTAPLPSHKDSSSEEEEKDSSEEEEEEGSSEEEEEGSSEEEEPPPPQDKDDEEEEPVQRPPPQEKEVEAPEPPQKPAPKKTAAFQRVWPTDDEVRILEILVAHCKEHGSRPKPKALFGIFAGKLSNPDYGSKELQGKVKNLRTKYRDLVKKGEVPRNEHDRQIIELSKLVYGGGTSKKAATAAASNGHESKGFEELCEMYPCFAEQVKQLEATYPGMCKSKFGEVEDDKARAMDEDFKRHRVDQMKLNMRLADLTKQQRKLDMRLSDMTKEATKTFFDIHHV